MLLMSAMTQPLTRHLPAEPWGRKMQRAGGKATDMRRALAIAVVLVALVVGTGCEPAMKITARPVQPACYNDAVTGTVTPAGATTKVVMQRTVSGKWVDWKWYRGSDPVPRVLTATPDAEGVYQLDYEGEKPDGTPLTGVVHFRVRSSGGGTVSNDFYVKFPKVC